MSFMNKEKLEERLQEVLMTPVYIRSILVYKQNQKTKSDQIITSFTYSAVVVRMT